MNLTKDCFDILKNYSGINKSLLFQKGVKNKGTKIRTLSEDSAILSEVQVSDVFPVPFGIFDLTEFLNVLSLFKNPDLNFKDDAFVNISEGKSSVRYFYAADSMITSPPSDTSKVESAIAEAEVSFSVSQEDLEKVVKASSVLGSSYIGVVSDGKTVTLDAMDIKNESSNTFSLEVGEGNGSEFKMIFKTENVNKLLKGNYDVLISSQNISSFKNTELPLVYYIALEDQSSYNGN